MQTRKVQIEKVSQLLKITFLRSFSCLQKIEAFENRLYSHVLHQSPHLSEIYSQYEKKAKLASMIKAAKAELKRKR